MYTCISNLVPNTSAVYFTSTYTKDFTVILRSCMREQIAPGRFSQKNGLGPRLTTCVQYGSESCCREGERSVLHTRGQHANRACSGRHRSALICLGKKPGKYKFAAAKNPASSTLAMTKNNDTIDRDP